MNRRTDRGTGPDAEAGADAAAPRPRAGTPAGLAPGRLWTGSDPDAPRYLRTWFAVIGYWISTCYAAEIAAGNTFSWSVVAYAAGAAIYLVLPQEPSMIALSCVLACCTTAVVIRRRTADHTVILTVLTMCIAGVWTGSLKAHLIANPRLDHERTVVVTGWVTDEEAVLQGAIRATVKVATMTGRNLTKEHTPDRITVTFRATAPSFTVGTGIRFTARLSPPSGPVMPGGYDFARRAFFEGRGASGFALGHIGAIDPGPLDPATRCLAAISELRHMMSERIRQALPGARGAIAAAIIVGETRAIPDAENDAIRQSGLPHMITIAGLHMSIVAGAVFMAVRWMLALIPAIALQFPIKKWAAAAALCATTVYVLISGGHLSAERAYLMSAIMLLATMMGRPAVTMRNLGLSALILVAFNPAEVIEPGFLMSFLAVMALIAAYRAWFDWRNTRARPPEHQADGAVINGLRVIFRHGTLVASSTLIATFATAWVTADQFFRVPPYGIISNLIVLPAIELVAMPAAVIACIAMPFGLEAVPLTVMGWAIDFMNWIGAVVAAFPGGQGLVGRIHPWASGCAIAGLCWLCLWQRSWRLLGVLPLLTAFALAPFAGRPDILITADATAVAARGADGTLKVLGAKSNRFTVANWLTADGAPNAPADPRVPLDPHLGDGWTCDTLGCSFTRLGSGHRMTTTIAVVTDARAFAEDCRKADIVISRLTAPDYCRARTRVFDRSSLERSGAVALTFQTSQGGEPVHGRTDGDISTLPSESLASDPPQDFIIEASLPVGARPWIPPPRAPLHPAALPPVSLQSRPSQATESHLPPEADDDATEPADTSGRELQIRSVPLTGPQPTPRQSAAPPALDPTERSDLPDP